MAYSKIETLLEEFSNGDVAITFKCQSDFSKFLAALSNFVNDSKSVFENVPTNLNDGEEYEGYSGYKEFFFVNRDRNRYIFRTGNLCTELYLLSRRKTTLYIWTDKDNKAADNYNYSRQSSNLKFRQGDLVEIVKEGGNEEPAIAIVCKNYDPALYCVLLKGFIGSSFKRRWKKFTDFNGNPEGYLINPAEFSVRKIYNSKGLIKVDKTTYKSYNNKEIYKLKDCNFEVTKVANDVTDYKVVKIKNYDGNRVACYVFVNGEVGSGSWNCSKESETTATRYAFIKAEICKLENDLTCPKKYF